MVILSRNSRIDLSKGHFCEFFLNVVGIFGSRFTITPCLDWQLSPATYVLKNVSPSQNTFPNSNFHHQLSNLNTPSIRKYSPHLSEMDSISYWTKQIVVEQLNKPTARPCICLLH